MSISAWLIELLLHLGQENSMGPGSDTRFARIGVDQQWIAQDIPVANHKPRNDV